MRLNNHTNKLNDNKRIGILGGTFNPIHLGHINIAKSALLECDLDEVWFIPNGCPPHKNVADKITAISRYNMTSAAISDEVKFFINDIELSSIEYNYTHETLRVLKDTYPNNKFYFIIGEDSLEKFNTWKKPELICSYASILVAVRSDGNKEHISKLVTQCAKKYSGEFLLLNADYVEASSTDIRDDLKKNVTSSLVDSKVNQYIHNHMVYDVIDYSKYTSISDIKKELHSKLKPSRYQHTIGVMYTAMNLGMRYDIPMEMCQYAGLLHDSAKNLNNEELIDFCENHDIDITEAEYKAPHLLHGKVGAYIAEHEYHIDDSRIIDAIVYHTTGRNNMTLLEQIIFVADYIEPNRNQANRLEEIRAMAYYDIDIATAMILQDTISYLKDINAFIDETTINTYEYYSNIVRK